MHGVSRRVIRLLSHIRVISSGAASGVTSASSVCRCAGRPARFALRHVTTTDAGGTSVLKLIGELLHSESTCLNQAVRERFRRSNPGVSVANTARSDATRKSQPSAISRCSSSNAAKSCPMLSRMSDTASAEPSPPTRRRQSGANPSWLRTENSPRFREQC